MGRYLGQHFLINKDKIRKIVETLELKDGDVIIEIGPGHGELTNEIVLKFQGLKIPKFKIIAIEKDKKLAEILRNKMALPYREAPSGKVMVNKRAKGGAGESIVEIIEGDALKEIKSRDPLLWVPRNLKSVNQKKSSGDLSSAKTKIIKNLKIIGNIPYYITGYLLRILGELENKPSLIVLTIQKEVAERVCAKVGKTNLLAASVQFWAKPEIVDFISKKDFKPMPKVDSAIIRLAIRVQPLATRENADKYYQFIRILFKQPRKTIVNNLEFRIKNLE
ncbi:MAG: rRNA adenine dimethyltransferase family protein, partial [Patescibacteria group bacterium]